MSGQQRLPDAVTQSAASWTNPAGAMPSDGGAFAYSVNGNGYLYFDFPPFAIPAGNQVVGFRVDASVCEQRLVFAQGEPPTALVSPEAGYFRTLTAELSKDGSAYAGTPRRAADFAALSDFVDRSFGGEADLWGLSWTPAEANGANLRVRVRRPASLPDEDVSGYRTVASLSLTVFYIPVGGSFIMPQERIAALQQSIIGKETVGRGVFAAPSIRLKAARLQFSSKTEVVDFETQGNLLADASAIVTEMGEGSVTGYPTYDEIGLLFASVISKPRTTTVAPGVYRHEFPLNVKGVSDPQTYSHEYGDANAAERTVYTLLTELGFSLNRKEPKLSAKGIGKTPGNNSDRTSITPGANCVFTLTMGSATTFTLRYDGSTTAILNTAGLNAGALQTALQGLASVGAGNLLVSGAGPYTITGAGALAGAQLPLLEIASFAGGTTPTVAYSTKGGYTEFDAVPILGGQVSVYYAPSRDTLSANKLTRLFEGDLNMGNRFGEFWTLNDAEPSFAGVVETPMSLGVTMTLAADSIAQGMAADARAQTQRYMRIEATGLEITPGNPYKMTIDLSCKCRDIQGFKDAEGTIFARQFGVGARYDAAWGRAAQIVLINATPSY